MIAQPVTTTLKVLQKPEHAHAEPLWEGKRPYLEDTVLKTDVTCPTLPSRQCPQSTQCS